MKGAFEVEVCSTGPVLIDTDRTLCTQPLYTSQSAITIEINLLPGADIPKAINEVCNALTDLGLMRR